MPGRAVINRRRSNDHSVDTIVVGLGAMGSAVVYQLAKRGNRVLGLDRFSPPHANGSSHGESRIIRQAIGEGEEYVPLVLRSYELWREIENESGKKLLTITGGLTLESQKARPLCTAGVIFWIKRSAVPRSSTSAMKSSKPRA